MAEYIEREAVLQAVCVGCDGEGICDAPALCRIRAWVSAIPAEIIRENDKKAGLDALLVKKALDNQKKWRSK